MAFEVKILRKKEGLGPPAQLEYGTFATDGNRLYVGDRNNVPKATAGDLVSVSSGPLPVGSIITWIPGTFGNGSNGGFSPLVITLPDNFKECNGQQIFDSESLWDTRWVPNLTDDRFLMGSTVAGGIGGTNNVSHTHGIPGHKHGKGDLSIPLANASGAHLHPITDPGHSHVMNAAAMTGFEHTGNFGAHNPVVGGVSTNSSTTGISILDNAQNTAASNHTHDNDSFSGSVGKVIGGSDGDNTFTSLSSITENRPNFLSTKYIIKIK